MKTALGLIISLCLLSTSFAAEGDPAFWSWAATPPMGWNSYDAYGDSVTEAEFMANAEYVQAHLLEHGWRYVVVDYRWYAAPSGPLTMDAWSRLMPELNRFPSAANGAGFKPLADRVHAMGLKFGIHIMRGIPRQAYEASTAIKGSPATARDVGDPNNACSWLGDMVGVDMTKAGAQEYYDSLFELYASWGLDFVKVDDLSEPYRAPEIEAIRKAIDKCGRVIVFSLSPGATAVSHGPHVASQGNMWRVSWDGWDSWADLNQFFDYGAAWAGAGGPGHWPDSDMIPFGRIGIRSLGGDRWTNYTQIEQVTLMSLFCLLPSPLILGNSLPDNDAWTLSLFTNDEVLAVNQDPLGQPARRVAQSGGTEIWARTLQDGSKAVGLFNRGSASALVTMNWSELGLTGQQIVRDLWAKQTLGSFSGKFQATVAPHGSMLLNVAKVINVLAASQPTPADGAPVLDVGMLTWTAGSGATNHRVYFGTTETPPLVSTQAGTTYNPGSLAVNTTYFWRVDEVGPNGVTTGDLWRFTYTNSLFTGRDIVKNGVPILPGSSSLAFGSYRVSGGGNDIWDSDDAFHFNYQPWTGDGVLTARVSNFTNTHVWAKAGLMFRESLASNSPNTLVALTPGNGCTFQQRVVAGQESFFHPAGGLASPYWVRLVRTGNTFTAFRSADGVVWDQQQPAATVPMADPIYAGMAVTSHDASLLASADFDHVSFRLIAPTSLAATVLSDTQIRLTWSDHPGNSETAYVLDRSLAGANSWSVLTSTHAPHSSSYIDATALPATAYDFRVRCKNAAAESEYVQVSSITPASLGDHLPGWWRLQYFGNGLSIIPGNSGLNDNPDGDDLTNVEEFDAATNPTDRESSLKITSLVGAGNGTLISFPTVSGKNYIVERTTNLITGSWTPVIDTTNGRTQSDGTIPGDGTTREITDAPSAQWPARFYRIRTAGAAAFP